MKIKIVLAAYLVFFCTSFVFAQEQMANKCEGKDSVKDTLLKQAIEKSVANNSSIAFQAEELPCTHKKYIFNAFSRTFNKKIFSTSTGYSFVLLKNGEHPFSIDRFVFKTKQAAETVEKIIRKRKINNLQIESLTYYDLFLSENNLVFLIADRESFSANQPFFKIIKENFLMEQAPKANLPTAQ